MRQDLRTGADIRLPRLWLHVARLGLLALSALNLIIYIVGAPVYYAQLFPATTHVFRIA